MIWDRIVKRGRPQCDHRPPIDWTINDSVKVNGRWLRPGTEYKVKGIQGRLRFVRHVQVDGSRIEWIDGFDKNKQLRSVRPERVTKVHVKKTTRESEGK